MAASAKVLNIYELAEDILLHLPLRQLLLAQRVNTTFYDAIYGSPKINQVLFFKPSGKQSVEYRQASSNCCPMRDLNMGKYTLLDGGHWEHADRSTIRSIVKNPFSAIVDIYHGIHLQSLHEVVSFSLTYEPNPYRRITQASEVDGKQQPTFEESLNHMLLSHPTCNLVTIGQTGYYAHTGDYFRDLKESWDLRAEDNDGIRFGDLLNDIITEQDPDVLEPIFPVLGSQDWIDLPKDIDHLTGHETLHFLRADQ